MYRGTKVFAGIASFPAREAALGVTVASILPQVDELHVYLNDYPRVPAFLQHNKITVYRSQDTAGNLKDTGKFWAAAHVDGYFITLDDDLVYPTDYATVLLRGIEQYERKVVCTFHGRSFLTLPTTSYYRGALKRLYRCLGAQPHNRGVQFGGTGVMGMHTSTLRPRMEDFRAHGMADVWVGILAARNKVPIVSLAHRSGWITEVRGCDARQSIYIQNKHHDAVQTAAVNEHATLFVAAPAKTKG